MNDVRREPFELPRSSPLEEEPARVIYLSDVKLLLDARDRGLLSEGELRAALAHLQKFNRA
jgi:hypothetical protein